LRRRTRADKVATGIEKPRVSDYRRKKLTQDVKRVALWQIRELRNAQADLPEARAKAVMSARRAARLMNAGVRFTFGEEHDRAAEDILYALFSEPKARNYSARLLENGVAVVLRDQCAPSSQTAEP
jgi:hypothetical protein